MQDTAPISEFKATRKQTTAAIRLSHIESWKQSGLSMSEFCRQKGLSLSNFSSWVQTYNKSKVIFKPINVTSMPNNQEVQVQKNIIEVCFTQQIKIRFINVIDCSLVVSIAKELAKCS
jgi:transposase-like protein